MLSTTNRLSEKKNLMSKLLAGEDVRDEISALDTRILDVQQKMDTLISV